MRPFPRTLLLGLAAAFILSACVPPQPPVSSASLPPPPVTPPGAEEAMAVMQSGTVFLLRSGTWSLLKAGDLIRQGDSLRTAANSGVEIQVGGKVRAAFGENTSASWEILTSTPVKAEVRVFDGSVVVDSAPLDGSEFFRVTSPEGVLSVKGTRFAVVRKNGVTEVAVEQGVVDAQSSGRDLPVPAGQGAILAPEAPPARSENPQDSRKALNQFPPAQALDWSTISLFRRTVKVSPSDASILLGSRVVGRGVWSGLLKEGSQLTLSLRLDGFLPRELLVTGTAEEPEILEVTLEPAPPGAGAAKADLPPEEAEVLAEELKTLDKERYTLTLQLQELRQKAQDVEAQLAAARKERETLAENLRKSEGQRRTLSEALSQKMKELQQTLEANQ